MAEKEGSGSLFHDIANFLRNQRELSNQQESANISPAKRGRERFKLPVALFGTTFGFIAGMGVLTIIEYVLYPGSLLPRESFKIAGLVGAAIGYVKRRELTSFMLSGFRR